MTRKRRWLVAAAVALPALAVYLRTLYPGLVGTGDTPELQFVGRVLGTAHAPGYPLYVLISWAFGHLPVGSLAYRINLLSAVLGAAAAALVALGALRLQCRPVVAVAVGLAFAFGRVFWSQAILAEVYTMAAVLLAAVLLGLLTWAETRRDSALAFALACSALAFAHHSVDIVVVAPAFALFVLMTDARTAGRPRVIVGTIAAAASGVLAYGFVLLRTRQAAPYLGAHASNLGEVLDLLRGGPFAERLFAFDARAVVFERLPAVARILGRELSAPGLALFFLGVAVLLVRRRTEAMLFLLGAAGVLFFVLNYDVPDLEPFLVPALVLIWPVAGIGLEALFQRARVLPRPALATAALVLPAAALLANYRANDHRQRDFEERYFHAVMEALPQSAAMVYESYTVEQMLRYQLLGEGYAGRKQIALSARDPESLDAYRRRGYAIFAFERGARELAQAGWSLALYPIPDRSPEERLRRIPKGTVVVWAGASPASGVFGGAATGWGGCTVGARIAGQETAVERTGVDSSDLTLAAGSPIGEKGFSAPVSIRAVCGQGAGEIQVGGRVVGRSSFGLAWVALSADGHVIERHDLDADAAPLLPFRPRSFPLSRVVSEPDCATIENRGFVEVTRQAAGGRLLVASDSAAERDSDLVLWFAGDRKVQPRLSESRGNPEAEVRSFRSGEKALLAALAADRLSSDGRIHRAPYLSRLGLTVPGRDESFTTLVDLGGAASYAVARSRVGFDEPWRTRFCGLPAGGAPLLAHPEERAAHISFGPAGAPYLGDGWWGPESEGPLGFRWSASPEAQVLVPLARGGPFRVEVHARPADGGALIGLGVNTWKAEARRLGQGWNSYVWTVPEAVWREGTNRVQITVPRLTSPNAGDGRALGVAVARLRLVVLSP